MPNRLAHESSPYLLQHANNPVDWFSWGAEALQKAAREDKPIFLSIGYSACHWCHVMEHESFEDPNIAAYLKEHFVSIKVDREERPDLDHIYMQAVMAISGGRGGWPLSAFLTPDQQVFFGGTYWPPHSRHGMPGFDHVLKMVHEAFHFKRDQVIEQSRQLTDLLNLQTESEPTELSDDVLKTAARTLERSFDFTYGGFGSAPKFPHTMDLQLLLRLWSRWPENKAPSASRMLEMVRLNLDKMYRGGIYDHLAGGFARYSVDERWLVPHFEKMLYDNSLLTDAYLDAFLVTGERQFAQTAMETLDYILNYLTDPAGGFHSTEDADSEGEEGKFYLWTVEEIRAVLGEEAGDRFCEVYDVSEIGNFEGRNILNLSRSIEQTAALKNWDLQQLQTELQSAKKQLLKVRDQRVRPGKDDKILTSWNALMISAMARAAHVLGDERYLIAASRAADFLLQNLRKENGRLLRSWRHGKAKLDAYLDDYTYLINALLTLYESSFDSRWLKTAVELAEIVLSRFADKHLGGFYFTADDHEQLIARIKEYQDSSIPSGNSMAAFAFARLGHLTGNSEYLDIARRTAESCAALLTRSPTAFGQMLLVLDMLQRPIKQIVIAADDAEQANQLLLPLRNRFLPDAVLAFAAPPDQPSPECLSGLLEGKQMIDGQPTLYVCEGFTCLQPVEGEAEIAAALTQLGYKA